MKNLVTLLLLAMFGGSLFCQTNSAILNLESSDQGFLPPRMTEAERDAILVPTDGLIIFNTSTETLNVFQESTDNWNTLSTTDQSLELEQKLSISGLSFRPMNSSVQWAVKPFGFQGNGFYIISPQDAAGYAHIPLPAKTEITSVEFSFIDDDPNENLTMSIIYFGNPQSSPTEIVSFVSGVTSLSQAASSASVGVGHTTFLNANYYVKVHTDNWTEDLRINGVRLSYVLPNQ